MIPSVAPHALQASVCDEQPLSIGGEIALSGNKKPHERPTTPGDPHRHGIGRSANEVRVHIRQRSAPFKWWKFRLVPRIGYSYSGNKQEKTARTKGEQTITCCTDTLVPLVAVTQQKATSRKTLFVPDTEVEETL